METKIPQFFMKFTPDGEVPVCHHDGVEELLPVREVPLVMPAGFEEKHHQAMATLGDWVAAIKGTARQLPTLRGELLRSGVSKATLTDLEDMRLIKCTVVPVLKEGAPTGARAFVYFTPMGRAYMKEKINGAG